MILLYYVHCYCSTMITCYFCAKCTTKTHVMHAYCTPTVLIRSAYCTPTARLLYTYCTDTVRVLYTYCMPTAHLLYCYCAPHVRIVLAADLGCPPAMQAARLRHLSEPQAAACRYERLKEKAPIYDCVVSSCCIGLYSMSGDAF